jgi:arginine decarboxylase-like protein
MSIKLCSKIAIYDRQGDVRQLQLFWVEKTNKVVAHEDGQVKTILMKEDATVMDALQELGYNGKMTLEVYAPNHYKADTLLDTPLSTAPLHRLVMTPAGIEIVGNPFQGM